MAGKMYTMDPSMVGPFAAGLRPMTEPEMTTLSNAMDPQRNLAKVFSIVTLFLGILTMFVPMTSDMCMPLFFLSIMTFGLTVGVAIEGSRNNKALKEGVIMDFSGQVQSPGFGSKMVGPVSFRVPFTVSSAVQDGTSITVGLVPSIGKVLSFNGRAIPKPIPAWVPGNLDMLVQGNVYVWPEITGEGSEPSASAAPVTAMPVAAKAPAVAAPVAAPVVVATPVAAPVPVFAAPVAVTAPAPYTPVKKARPPASKAMTYCPFHGIRTELKDGVVWCKECNKTVLPLPKFCPYHGCRTEIEEGKAICPRCNDVVEAP